MLDLANSLPSAWEHNMCILTEDESNVSQPSQSWLLAFWTLVADFWRTIPEDLCSFALVPVHAGRLASVAHCRNMGAIRAAHLAELPQGAATVLTSVGCLCITKGKADSASPVRDRHEPLMAALRAVSAHTGVPLRRLVSERS